MIRLLKCHSGLLAVLASLASCGQIPGLDAALEERNAGTEYPDILPASELPTPAPPRLTETTEAELEARRARLERRAAALQ
ncbi:hypothetical protein [Shimia marina]|uniref:Uncharacterized protein n=1 Tax=Shimia marina TaxID=321267 RepID=A0A0P1FBZ3_9RHOB|nr:hypothetical protein [Shimia marina]CUH52224.1 hypothetical protein SHM7688_01666 [Shimia marina]SFE74175.1 hypothetical protein SAMN04488037_11828 [Shimia marina]